MARITASHASHGESKTPQVKTIIDIEKRSERLLAGYQEWLGIIGYAESSVKTLPKQLEPFFLYLKREGITNLELVPKEIIRSYYETLQTRKSKQTGELLKNQTLNSHIRNLNLFSHYLEETDQGYLQIDLPYETREDTERDILTLHEISELYQVCTEGKEGLKERTILNLYYGCGLRCKEGLQLNVSDIQLDKRLLHIRITKNRKSRNVPFIDQIQKSLSDYLHHYQPKKLLLDGMSSSTVHRILRSLIERTENEALQEKNIGLHSLRHSIATHLLYQGMPIDQISEFLGHSSIMSTQTYLHVSYESAQYL